MTKFELVLEPVPTKAMFPLIDEIKLDPPKLKLGNKFPA